MDILFKSHFILTEELLLECRSVFAGKRNIILGWLSLFLGVYSAIFLENDLRKLFACTVFILSLILQMFIIPRLRAKRMYK